MNARICSETDKVCFDSKKAALAAAHRVEDHDRNQGPGTLTAYRCDGVAHWHIGHTTTPTKQTPPRTKGVKRPKFTPVQWEEATMLLWARCRDRCEWCGQPLNGEMVRHHRMRRAVGGDRLANLVALHDRCHKTIHAEPEVATMTGHIISSYHQNLAAVPIRLPDGRAWLLHDNGKKDPQP